MINSVSEWMNIMNKQHFLGAVLGGALVFAASGAMALPALQLGNGGGASFDAGTQTWTYSSNPFSLLAFANTSAFGSAGGPTAFLVVAADPSTMVGGDLFDVAISVNGTTLTTPYASGNGTPPVTDPNSLAPHSIFDTYYELFMFDFDGPVQAIYDTQPGSSGTGTGYEEIIGVTVNSHSPIISGLHFDLFTMDGNGQVTRFAPFSHDADWEMSGGGGGGGTSIVEPTALALFGLGLAGIGLVARRRRKA